MENKALTLHMDYAALELVALASAQAQAATATSSTLDALREAGFRVVVDHEANVTSKLSDLLSEAVEIPKPWPRPRETTTRAMHDAMIGRPSKGKW